MKKKLFLFLLASLTIASVQGQWTNPLSLDGEWDGNAGWGARQMYGIGDPYIMKYRGVYYLYCSTRDGQNGVKYWSTKDFITWSNVYDCAFNPSTSEMRTAYAPEVVYWNGKFYMYTSPAGNGHYVLESDSPTGPFTRVTANLGKGIDGSVFIEDNGQVVYSRKSETSINLSHLAKGFYLLQAKTSGEVYTTQLIKK